MKLKKIISISLSLILLLGNVGLTFGTHICGGHAVMSELMIGEKHLDCGMAMMDMVEEDFGDQHFSKPPCCENKYVSVDTEELFKKDISKGLAPFFVAGIIFQILYSVEFVSNENQPIPADTSPPFLKQDFQASYQVFLI